MFLDLNLENNFEFQPNNLKLNAFYFLIHWPILSGSC